MTETTYRWFVQPQDDATNDSVMELIAGQPENILPGPVCADGVVRHLLEVTLDQIEFLFRSIEGHNLHFKPFNQAVGPKTPQGGKIKAVPFFVLRDMVNPRVGSWRRQITRQLKAKAARP